MIERDHQTIIALDLGTTTGWAAYRSAYTGVESGTVEFKTDRFQGGGMRYLNFVHFLNKLRIGYSSIGAIYFEEVRRHLGVDAAHAYGGFMAHLTAWCEQYQIAYQGVPVGTIKKHATGKGNAGKGAVISAVKAMGYAPKDDNEADALALMHYVLDKRLGEI